MCGDIRTCPPRFACSPTSLVGLAVAVLLLVMGCSPADEPGPEPADTPTATPEPTPTPDPAEQWTSCTSPDGYTIDYPADWATNEEPIDDLPPCSLFDPEPAQLRTEGMQLPADIAVSASMEAAPFHDVTAEEPHAEQVHRRESTVEGRDAVRIEQEATGEGLYPQGQRSTIWAVDLDGVTFVARSLDVGDPDYATKQQVLDDMVASVRFDEAP